MTIQWSSPKSSSPESDGSQDYSSSLIPGSVSGKDNVELVQQYQVCESVKREGNTDTIANTVTESRKRSISKAFPAEQVENDGVRAKQKTKTEADIAARPRRQLACPFQKQDSLKHHECLKYALHRIKDVKQHIYRRHKQPDYYCACCFEVFKTADERDEHARSKNCDNLDVPGFEGISEAQKHTLNKSSSRSLDTQGQWFKMWDIIFPGERQPSSVWVGSYMEEMVPLLRSLWKNKSSNILAQALKDQPRHLDRALMGSVVELIFDFLEAEASASLWKRAPGTCPQNQHNLPNDQVPTSTPPSEVINELTHSLMFAEPHYFFQEINAEPEAEFQNGFVFGE